MNLLTESRHYSWSGYAWLGGIHAGKWVWREEKKGYKQATDSEGLKEKVPLEQGACRTRSVYLYVFWQAIPARIADVMVVTTHITWLNQNTRPQSFIEYSNEDSFILN